MNTGWNESLDKLAKVLEEEKIRRAKTRIVAEPGKQEASVIRIFDAPREVPGVYSTGMPKAMIIGSTACITR